MVEVSGQVADLITKPTSAQILVVSVIFRKGANEATSGRSWSRVRTSREILLIWGKRTKGGQPPKEPGPALFFIFLPEHRPLSIHIIVLFQYLFLKVCIRSIFLWLKYITKTVFKIYHSKPQSIFSSKISQSNFSNCVSSFLFCYQKMSRPERCSTNSITRDNRRSSNFKMQHRYELVSCW